ncbi:HesA/MoeB/ThiF family protein [Allosphingosinicella flava]|uniref:HesA/MoeB/ThiF family protein n=1 Tax=Allosphingosinicella flava TaxID=2771430 RepID=A0A7T2GL87_9SPHN|nr:HesA/MoeB/ThiF family protein [Sphingosinicella flava]QPQ55935.1 HesA/MoeB/ThiF family protein [Sphingosinicella flava]
MNLTDAQLDRYARHIVLREIGGAGQKKLLDAHVALIGAGGIGSPALQYLAAAGVGTLTVIDDDAVALSNLQRQTLYRTSEIGMPKAEAASLFAEALNPEVAIMPVIERIDARNAERLLGNADVILDGCDTFETRLIVADAATRLRIPLVSAAVAQFEGQIAVYRGWESGEACYRCFVGSEPGLPEQSCAEQGVLGAMAGVVGSLAALEVIRAVAGFGASRSGQLLRIDALDMRFRSARIAKDPACPACGR